MFLSLHSPLYPMFGVFVLSHLRVHLSITPTTKAQTQAVKHSRRDEGGRTRLVINVRGQWWSGPRDNFISAELI